MRFFVIRHGETAWNVEGRFQGQKDTALNEKGLAQAATLGERLAGHSFEAVLTSPLDRAKKTAELAASKCEFGEFTEIPAFTEINHGDWEGRLSTEVAEEWPELLRRWHTAPETVKMPGEGGESLEDIARSPRLKRRRKNTRATCFSPRTTRSSRFCSATGSTPRFRAFSDSRCRTAASR